MTNCPCCGFSISESSTFLQWNRKTRVVAYKGASLRFTEFRAKIFDCIWAATQKDKFTTLRVVVESAYEGDYTGGPEEAEKSVSVTLTKIRAHLQGIGLTITKGALRIEPFNGSAEEMLEHATRGKKYDAYDFRRYQKKKTDLDRMNARQH